MKSHAMVWIAAASLHDQGRAPFQRRELLAEVRRLFPHANPETIISYIDTKTNVSSRAPNSFNYLIHAASRAYRLTKPGDPNPAGKPRWPRLTEVEPPYADLWNRWVTWQQEQPDDTAPTALQCLLEQRLVAFLPPPVTVERNGALITLEQGFEIAASIGPEQLWLRTMSTYWDCQTPVLQPERELTLRLDRTPDKGPAFAAGGIMAVVKAVFGERIGRYRACADCGAFFPPERMTETWCHGCASANHFVIY